MSHAAIRDRIKRIQSHLNVPADGLIGPTTLTAIENAIFKEPGKEVVAKSFSLTVSKKGAKGLMQLMDETADDMGVRNVFDPAENIEGGCRYLRYLTDRFGGKTEHVLAGYNAGPSMVDRYGGIPPFRETIHYVRNVTAIREEYERKLPADTSKPPEKPKPPPPARRLRVYVDASGTIHVTNTP